MITGNDFKDFNEQDFINHPLFQDWILYPTEERDRFWQDFFAAHPGKKEAAEKARTLLTAIAFEESWPEDEKIDGSLSNALNIINGNGKKTPVYNIRARVRPIYKWVAAAVVLVLIASGLWMYSRQSSRVGNATAVTTAAQDVAPGGDKAILTLGNGTKVVLDTAGNGAVTRQGNVTVVKLNGQLAYNKQDGAATEVLYNTITTPRGGQYQIVLADGSRVWLNAESSLRFPTAFAGKQRKVELTGEGYFEVAHNEQQPFVVQRGDAEVQVLGTHFNVNGYTDEPSLKVTLLQGRVRVKKNDQLVYLNPGQQAVVQGGQQSIKVDYDVDTEEVTAWKNGLFVFNNTPLETIMKQLERWYDVEVMYQGTVPQDRFNGSISRDNNLSEVLKVLEYSNIKFSVQGKVITVLPQ